MNINTFLLIISCILISCYEIASFSISRSRIFLTSSFERSTDPRRSSFFTRKGKTTIFNVEQPSDSHDNDDDLSAPGSGFYVETEEDLALREALKRELLLMCSVTSRGEFIVNDEEKNLIVDIVTQLEALNPTVNPAMNSDGKWDLCLAGSLNTASSSNQRSSSNSALLRVSPFFLTLRTLLGDSNKEILKLLEDTIFGNGRLVTFGRLQQIVSNNELRSEVSIESTLGALSLLPIQPLKLTIITTAKLTMLPPSCWNIELKESKIDAGSNGIIGNLGKNAIPVGELLSKVSKGGSLPITRLNTLYVDEGIRITRDEDSNFFVFARE